MKLSEAEKGRLAGGLKMFAERLPYLDMEDFKFVLNLADKLETALRAEMQARVEKLKERRKE